MMKTLEPQLIAAGPAVERSGLAHRVWEPAPAGPHPTVILVHGRSGSQEVMWVFARTLPKNWLVVAPRALFADPQGGYSWEVRAGNDWPTVTDFTAGMAALTRFIEVLPELYDADLSRLFLMGFSQGAALCYALAMRRQVLVRGVAGLLGFVAEMGGNSAESPTLLDLPIFMAGGRQDPTIPLAKAENAAGRLIRAGARLDYRAYDSGHKLNAAGARDLTAWWRAQAAALAEGQST